MYDTDMTDEEARRRIQQLTAEFEAAHPTKAATNRLVESLSSPKKWKGGVEMRADRERGRAADVLQVRYNQLGDLFETMTPELEGYVYSRMREIIEAAHLLGKHDSPDGKAAHEARKGSGDAAFSTLVAAIKIYCGEREIEPKASWDFANIIRPDILEVLHFPKGAKRPSVSAIVKALQAVRRQTMP
jgi:hypothetical protein